MSTRRKFLQQAGSATLAALLGIRSEIDDPLPEGMYYFEQLTVEPRQMPVSKIFFMNDLDYPNSIFDLIDNNVDIPLDVIVAWDTIDTLRAAFLESMGMASV